MKVQLIASHNQWIVSAVRGNEAHTYRVLAKSAAEAIVAIATWLEGNVRITAVNIDPSHTHLLIPIESDDGLVVESMQI